MEIVNNLSDLNPIVSIIVAAYNQERYIGRCLRSLLQQSIPHHKYEIIVVNDGSTDKTEYALKLFIDPKDSVVRVITNEENLGLPASINKGIKASRAKYIVRVDSDDFVNANFVNFLLVYLETNPEVDAVACDYFLLDDMETMISRENCMDNPIACGIMFRKQQLFEIGLYDEQYRLHEEREMRIRFEKKFKIDRLKLPLYRYRRHNDNITNNLEGMKDYELKLSQKHGGNL
jgi:glycosyltransferase involved in cell wall biosynthesis